MARRTRGRFVRPAPKTKMWVGNGLVSLTMPASTKTLQGTYGAVILALRPFTILRTRLLVIYVTDQVTASEAPFGTLGFIIVTDTATGVGVTAVPNPSGVDGDADADWFVYQTMGDQVFSDNGTNFLQMRAGRQYVIDSKAMRKVGPNDDMAMVTDQQNAVGASLTIMGRQLIQLH